MKILYGALYNWNTISTGKICPVGLHVPNDDEWKQLELYIGMSGDQVNNSYWSGNTEALKIKTSTGWQNNGNVNNSKGFNAMPVGFRYSDGGYENAGNNVAW